MARGGKGIEAEMAELTAKRTELAARADALAAATREAEKLLADIPRRRQELFRDEARGLQPAESDGQLEGEGARLAAEIASKRARLEAIRHVDGEIRAKRCAIVDENPAHYVARAEAAAEQAETESRAAEQAMMLAVEVTKAAEVAWIVVHESRLRRSEMPAPQVPSPAFATSVFAGVGGADGRNPWPGGSREAWEEWREHSQGTQAAA